MLSDVTRHGAQNLADGLKECELDGAALERQGEDTWAESGGSRVRTHQKRGKKEKK